MEEFTWTNTATFLNNQGMKKKKIHTAAKMNENITTQLGQWASDAIHPKLYKELKNKFKESEKKKTTKAVKSSLKKQTD